MLQVCAMSTASTADGWWKTADVQAYLGLPSLNATRIWMWRHRVRRSPIHKRLTRKEWVDAALSRTRRSE